MAYLTKKKRGVKLHLLKVTVGSQNLKTRSRDHGHAPLGAIHYPSDTIGRGLSNKEKTRRLASPVQKLQRGSHNLKSRSREPDHAPIGVTHHPSDTTSHGLSNKEKTRCLASPVQKLRRGSQKLKVGHMSMATPLRGHSLPLGYYSPWPIQQRKNEVSGFTRSKVTEGSHNLKSRSRDPDHALI